LTLQGEFDDEIMNQIYTPMSTSPSVASKVEEEIEGDDEGEEEEEEGDDGDEELTIDEIIAMEGLDQDNDDDILDEEDEDEDDNSSNSRSKNDRDKNSNNDMKSFLNSSPAGKNDIQNNIPDMLIYRPEKPDLSNIPPGAIVTEEDTKSLRKAHRKADKIIQYAADVKLIASFHYSKQNFHLVKLLEVSYYQTNYS
jgi:hypothetical protein